MTISEWLLVATLIIHVVLSCATVMLVKVTKEYSNHTRKLVEERKKENEPNVLAYFDVPHGTEEIYLVVENIGKKMGGENRSTKSRISGEIEVIL